MIFAALSSVFSIVGPKLLGKVTTKLAEGLMAYYFQTGLYMDFAYIGRLIVILIILYCISMAFAYAQSFIMSGVSMEVTYNLRKEIDQKISRLPLKYYDTCTHGEVLSTDHERCRHDQPVAEPKHLAAHHLSCHRHRCPRDDVEHQRADDGGGDSHGVDVVRTHRHDHQDIAEIVQGAARRRSAQ